MNNIIVDWNPSVCLLSGGTRRSTVPLYKYLIVSSHDLFTKRWGDLCTVTRLLFNYKRFYVHLFTRGTLNATTDCRESTRNGYPVDWMRRQIVGPVVCRITKTGKLCRRHSGDLITLQPGLITRLIQTYPRRRLLAAVCLCRCTHVYSVNVDKGHFLKKLFASKQTCVHRDQKLFGALNYGSFIQESIL